MDGRLRDRQQRSGLSRTDVIAAAAGLVLLGTIVVSSKPSWTFALALLAGAVWNYVTWDWLPIRRWPRARKVWRRHVLTCALFVAAALAAAAQLYVD